MNHTDVLFNILALAISTSNLVQLFP